MGWIRDWAEIVGKAGILGMAITMTIVFLVAFIQPTKQVIVDINRFGEAKLELFIVLFSWLCYIFMVLKSYEV